LPDFASTSPRGHERLLVGSRLALAVGFGSLLLIMALSGLDALRVLQNFRHSEARIRRQFLYRNHVLNDIRSDVYVSGTYVRDYLLDPETARAEGFRKTLEEVHSKMETALQSYAGQLDPEQTQHYEALKNELARYWDTLAPVFKWSAIERRSLGYAFLRDEVFPRRQNMLAIADRIAALNEQQLNAANDQVSGLLADFELRIGVTLLVALALGLSMAAFSVRRILRLEQQAHAQFLAVAEARSQLQDLSARLVQAQETERRALSRELHDEVGQSLSAVLIELRNLASGLGPRADEHTRSQVDLIKRLVEGTVRVIRNMALLLRPSMLDDLGLVPALRWQAREVSKRTSIDVSVAAETHSEDYPDAYKTCIYRIVQEALNNCERHSRASTVRIRVQEERDQLRLSIQDDGCGFDFEQSKGMGLLGIQERVASLHGTCGVHSSPGGGTLLTVELPFRSSSIQGEGKLGSDGARQADPHPVS
jgi:signal transduction histidine kinase